MDNNRGMTLMELMVATMLIGIGFLVSFAAYAAITRSIQYSKAKTLAANIAQEKMQIIMQKSYYEVVVTSDPVYRTDVTPNIPYDPGYYPPETLLEGGIFFTRYTYIQAAREDSGAIVLMSPDTPDTGMRKITETVLWRTESGFKTLSIQSVLNNPNTVMASAILTGFVKSSTTLAGIPSALVNAAENIGWRDTAASNGQYSINLSPGTFDFQASAPGYFPQIIPKTLITNVSTSQDFYLITINSGTVQGTAWINTHPLISQVVASSTTNRDYEYIELYNPTTSYITMTVGNFHLCKQDSACVFSSVTPFVNTVNWPPRSYYLIANYNDTIVIGTVTRNVDAYYPAAGSHFLNTGQPGSVRLHFTPYAGAPADSIGWNNGAAHFACAGYYETLASTAAGMAVGEQLVRRTSTGTLNTTYASAYDTDNNSVDFVEYGSVSKLPSNSTIAKTPIAGTPAAGAIVSVIDGLSMPSSATLVGNPPYARFSVPGVATGTWIVYIDSGNYSAEIATVSVVANSTTSIPNASTQPSWPATATHATILATSSVTGMISGVVKNVANVPLSGITVSAGNTSAVTASNGIYYIRLATGTYDLISNPNNANPLYASQTQTGVTVSLGDLTSNMNYILSQGGKVRGSVTRDGTNPLPGVGIVALDVNGNAIDNEIAGTNGQFLLTNLSTGTYLIKPSLDLREAASPSSTTVTVTAGNTVSAGTFTVTGALGSITGSVTLAGKPIKSGVLVVVSTQTISSPPIALSSATLTSAAVYANSSSENGTYQVDVRGSTTSVYNVAAFYMTLNGQSTVVSSRTTTSVTVTAGVTTSGVNFSW